MTQNKKLSGSDVIGTIILLGFAIALALLPILGVLALFGII